MINYIQEVAIMRQRERRIKLNTAKLKGKMRELNITQEELAKLIGVALSTLNRKLQDDKSGDTFTIGEIIKIVEVLKLSKEEAIIIFLPLLSQ